MLENWCWEPKVLEKMSSHYESKEPLSPELIDKIIKSRYVNVGLFYLRQIFFAKFDLKVHTDQEKDDYTELWSSLREKISLVKSGKPCPGQGTFGHITGGYDAGYYGYTYSLVFAADMYGELILCPCCWYVIGVLIPLILFQLLSSKPTLLTPLVASNTAIRFFAGVVAEKRLTRSR
jgi:Peptidase family M3